MSNLTLLGRLANGRPVYDRHQSHLHEGVKALLSEALARVSPERGENFLARELDFGRVIGQTVCVATSDTDEIVFAQRVGRQGWSRFVKGRLAEDSQYLMVILKRDDFEDYWVLITAFVGRRAQPEPWDRNLRTTAAKTDAFAFWTTHALVWGSESVVPGTETTRIPW